MWTNKHFQVIVSLMKKITQGDGVYSDFGGRQWVGRVLWIE